MRTTLLIFLIALVLGGAWRPADARWVRYYAWRPDPRFVLPEPPTHADLRYRLCTLESGARGYRDAEAAAIRCELRYSR